MDDSRLAGLGQFTPEGVLTPGYGDHYLFMVGRDDVHGILHSLIPQETLRFRLNMFGYDDDTLNADIMGLLKNPAVAVQATLDKSQSGGVHERALLAADEAADPEFYNSIVIGQSETHQISHTKGGVFTALGLGFEGSTNWSNSGEGTGVALKPGMHSVPGFKAQNNTLLVSANPVFLARFAARLDVEHQTALAQQAPAATGG